MSLFGQLFARRMSLETQYKITSKTRELRNLQKQHAREMKLFNMDKRSKMNALNSQSYMMTASLNQASLWNMVKEQLGGDAATLAELRKEDGSFTAQGLQALSDMRANVMQYNSMTMSDLKTQIENEYEMRQQMIEEQAKDEEQDIETEIETLKNQKEMYDGQAKMEEQFNKENMKQMFGQ